MRRTYRKLGLALVMAAGAASAQVRTIDPNSAIDGDLGPSTPAPRAPRAAAAEPSYRTYPDAASDAAPDTADAAPDAADDAGPSGAAPAQEPVRRPAPRPAAGTSPGAATRAEETYHRDDLIAAGEDVFGRGASGLAGLIERILKEQGEPNAYIAGREASGAFVLGLRYGSGVMSHKVEGQRPVYWTGPSVGFDAGGDANKVFVLVYNLYDTEELFRRFPAAEGRLYAVGGFAATYLRRGKVVLIPVRLGVGWRAGVNVGYMKFSRKTRWLPF